jgi:hypothetical protein
MPDAPTQRSVFHKTLTLLTEIESETVATTSLARETAPGVSPVPDDDP